MSELNKLRKVIETNFRLNGLQTRELSAQVSQRLTEVDQRLREVARTVDGLGAKVGQLGQTFQTTMDQQVDRNEDSFSNIR